MMTGGTLHFREPPHGKMGWKMDATSNSMMKWGFLWEDGMEHGWCHQNRMWIEDLELILG